MSHNASVCHTNFRDHRVTIALGELTQQLDVALNQLKYQLQRLHLFTLGSPLFHNLPAPDNTSLSRDIGQETTTYTM